MIDAGLISDERKKNLKNITVLTIKEQFEIFKSVKGFEPDIEINDISNDELDSDSAETLEEIRREMAFLRGQIQSKNSQIESKSFEVDRLYKQLQDSNRALDQSQQLQLQIQNQLDKVLTENKGLLEYKEENESKGFWARLFGG